jgi:hypothetical protein
MRIAFSVLLLTVAALAQPSTNPVVIDFGNGGDVRLQLSAGDIEIVPAKGGSIRIDWRTKDPDDMRKVKVKSHVDGKEAFINVDGPRNFSATIELPQESNLQIKMSAGVLNIGEFKGDKNVRLRAGDLTIKMGAPESYKYVEASVTSGGLDAPKFDVSKGGLWRSFKRKGDGIYELDAHVTAGQLTLR